MKLPALVLLLLVATPVASASWSVESSDTGAGQLTVWNDYWNDRTSHMGDVRSFNLTIQAPEAGAYAWSIPDEAGSRPNPLRLVFSSFTVRDEGGAELGDLVEGESLPSSFGAREEREIQFRFRIAELSPSTLEAIREEVDQNRAHYNQSAREDEVHGWIRLAQVDEPDGDAQGTSVQVQHALNVAMVLDLPGEALEVHAVDAGGDVRVVTIDGQRYAVVEGPEYEANDDGRARLTATGDLANRSLSFFLDELGKPLRNGDGAPATLTPDSAGGVEVRLPAGRHRIIYLVPIVDDEPGFTGTITLHGLDGEVLLGSDVAYTPAIPASSWWWVLAVVVALATAAAAVLLGHRFAHRRDEQPEPPAPSPSPRAGHEPNKGADRVEWNPGEVLRF